MAAPIAHIFCALSLLNNHAITVDNTTNFIIGTSFPDIRYLGVIERDKTHAYKLIWSDVKNASSSFEKGRLLHCLLDEKREAFVVKHNLYQFIPNSPLRTQILKFYEDTILYEMMKNWSDIANCFDTILPEEHAYNIKNDDLKTWHNLLKNYISQQPDVQQIAFFLQQHTALVALKESNPLKRFFIQCKGAIINKIVYFKLKSTLEKLKNNKKLTTAIMFFYKNLDRFLII